MFLCIFIAFNVFVKEKNALTVHQFIVYVFYVFMLILMN